MKTSQGLRLAVWSVVLTAMAFGCAGVAECSWYASDRVVTKYTLTGIG